MVIASSIARNRRKPAWKSRILAQRMKLSQGCEKNVLDQILGLAPGNMGQQDPVDYRREALIEFAECGAVSAARGGDYCQIIANPRCSRH